MPASKPASKEDSNEKAIQDVINSVESQETIRNIQNLTSESSNIFDKPSWIKTYSVLDNLNCFIKCILRVPGEEAGSITENYIKIDLFGNPPSYIKSFNFEMGYEEGGNKATLVFEDQSNVISDVLILRLEKYKKQATPSEYVFLDIEYGYQEPDYYLGKGIDKALKKKLKFTNTETFRLAKFTTAYADLKTTYTFELESQNTIETSETFTLKPYEILGSHPALRIRLFEILNGLSKTIENRSTAEALKISNELKKLGNKNNIKVKEKKALADKLEELKKGVENAKKLLPKLTNNPAFQLKDPNQKNNSLTELKRLSSNFKLVNDSLSAFTNNKEIQDIIASLSTYIGEEVVHPWDLFKYCFRAMMEQFNQDRKAPVPFILSFLDGMNYNDIKDFKSAEILADTYLDLIDKKLGDRIFGYKTSKEGEYDYLKAVAGIKVSSLTLTMTTSWEKLFKEIFGYLKMNPNNLVDPKSREAYNKKIKEQQLKAKKEAGKNSIPDEALRKIISQFPKIDYDFFVVDTYSDSTEEMVGPDGSPPTSVKRTGTVQKVLAQIEKFSQKLGNLDKPEKTNPDGTKEGESVESAKKYITKVTDFVNFFIEKHKNRKILYMILLEDLEGSHSPFNSGRWGNQVLQGYSYRLTKDNSKDPYFSIGRTNLSRNNFPDVLAFNITEYDFENTIRSINESQDTSVSVTVAGKEIKTNRINVDELKDKSVEEKTKALKDTGMTAEEFEKKIKGDKTFKNIQFNTKETTKFDYLKAYRNNDKMNLNFSASQILTSGDDNFADVARAKRSIEAYRGMMALRASTIKANIQILGEPQYDFFCLKKYIFVKLFNLDGSISMFTGIYRIIKITQNMDGGMLKTTLDLEKALSDPDQLGQIAKIFFTGDTIDSCVSTNTEKV
jgi:hypothetical protein